MKPTFEKEMMCEHFRYEVHMLKFCYEFLTNDCFKPQGEFNVYLESYAVHAKNLYRYLSDNYDICDENISDMIRLIDEQILEYPGKRMDTQAGKFSIKCVEETYSWLKRTLNQKKPEWIN